MQEISTPKKRVRATTPPWFCPSAVLPSRAMDAHPARRQVGPAPARARRAATIYVTPILSPSAVPVSRFNTPSILLSGILGSIGGGGQQHENQRWGSWRSGSAGGAAWWRTYLTGICAVDAAVLRRAQCGGGPNSPESAPSPPPPSSVGPRDRWEETLRDGAFRVEWR
jgi:hypothetical protein